MDLYEILRAKGAATAAVEMRLGANIVYKVMSDPESKSHRSPSDDFLVAAQRAWPGHLDLHGTLRRLHPDWDAVRVSAEAAVIVAKAAVPLEAAS